MNDNYLKVTSKLLQLTCTVHFFRYFMLMFGFTDLRDNMFRALGHGVGRMSIVLLETCPRQHLPQPMIYARHQFSTALHDVRLAKESVKIDSANTDEPGGLIYTVAIYIHSYTIPVLFNLFQAMGPHLPEFKY